MVLAKPEHENRISHICTDNVKTGIANTLGKEQSRSCPENWDLFSLCQYCPWNGIALSTGLLWLYLCDTSVTIPLTLIISYPVREESICVHTWCIYMYLYCQQTPLTGYWIALSWVSQGNCTSFPSTDFFSILRKFVTTICAVCTNSFCADWVKLFLFSILHLT